MPGRRPSTLFACATFVMLLAAPQVASADGVDQAQNKVDTLLDQLDDLENRMGQLDEDYGMAEHRRAQLEVEIGEAQVEIDALGSELGKVEQVLTQIAVDRFTSGDSLALSPVFTDISTYSTGQQMDALALAAIDVGQTDLDNIQQVADRLAAQQRWMQRKTDEAADLMETLDNARADYTELEAEYTKKYAQAKRDLGEAKLKAEQERRAAAAVAQRAKVAKAAAKTAAAAPRGGAQSSSAGTAASTSKVVAPSGGGGSASGRAAIAVNAALGQQGVPYKFATSEPGVSFDCSGLTAWAWAQAGVSMPHVSRLQYSSLPHVNVSDARPGDLIFYYSPISHVGIYLGNGQMVHAPNTGSVVNVSTVHWNKVVGVARPG